MAKRGPKPKGRVHLKWTSELAYAVGLITADGSLSKNRRHINFTSKDVDLIQTYQKCLGLEDIKVSKKSSGYNKEKLYYHIQFGDVLFYEFLESIGLFPNKSTSLGPVSVPDGYFFDFLRGEWDGDGTIYYTADKRWPNSYIVSVGFTSASLDFLEWLQVEINARIHTTGFISRGKRVLQLRYGRADSKKLFKAMFYKSNLPHLKRKFAKAQEIYRIIELNSLN